MPPTLPTSPPVGIDVGGTVAGQLATSDGQELAHWCRSVVQAPLTSIDWIDAVLCALSAQIAAAGGGCVHYGEPQTGWIVVPRA
jgi:predicted RNase H-like nuclease